MSVRRDLFCSTPQRRNTWGNVSVAFDPFEENQPTDFPTPEETFPFDQDVYSVPEDRIIEMYYAGDHILPETTFYHSMYRLRNLGAKSTPIAEYFPDTFDTAPDSDPLIIDTWGQYEPMYIDIREQAGEIPHTVIRDVLSSIHSGLSDETQFNYFDLLPEEMISEIANHLDGISLLSLAACNHRLFDILAPISEKRIAILDWNRYGDLLSGSYRIKPGNNTVLFTRFYFMCTFNARFLDRMEELYGLGIKYFSFRSSNVVITLDESRYMTHGEFSTNKFKYTVDRINRAFVNKWFRDGIIDADVRMNLVKKLFLETNRYNMDYAVPIETSNDMGMVD